MKTKMNRIKLFIACFIMLLSQVGFSQESGEWKIPLSDPNSRGELVADIRSGSITITGTSTKEVIVKYTTREKKVKEKEQTRDGLNRIAGGSIDLEAYEENNKVVVDSDNWNQGVDLEIQVPQNFDLHAETYNNGKILIKNVNGDLTLDNYNGSVKAENIKGSVIVETYNGDITVTFDEIKKDTPMSFVTYNGDIDLTMPSNTSASFKLKTKRGDIYEGFGIDYARGDTQTTSKEREGGVYRLKLDDWIRGSINGGGAEFTTQTYNGDIYLRNKN